MKSFTAFAVGALALASQASAHYIFETFSDGATKYPVYQYIRKNWNYNSPVTDLTSNDLRCNAGGETGNDTQTITMNAGDAFTFTTDVAVYHDGPLSMYMAKAPAGTPAVNFDGSGQVWFKILDIGPTFDSSGNSAWPLAQTYTFNIPKQLPSGDYLLRVQQLGIHNPYPGGTPQFYISCAQVTVVNGGTGNPGPLVKIPGFITGTEPGYTVNIYTNFHNYTVPGPAVWDGAPGTGSPSQPSTTAVAPPVTSAAPPVSTAAPTTLSTSVVVAPPQTTAASTGPVVPKYGQCGGMNWQGGTVCATGSTCKATNQYYSQCM